PARILTAEEDGNGAVQVWTSAVLHSAELLASGLLPQRANLGERTPKAGVAGSNPAWGTREKARTDHGAGLFDGRV
ncbi:hypothetical protein ACWCOY_37075, partial [Streptomyces tubercidicus]